MTVKGLVRIGGTLLFLFAVFAMNAQDLVIFERYREAMEQKKSLPIGELMIETARFFLDIPYVASTLEVEPERLVVNLRELDCTTLAETVLALSRTVQSADPSFDRFRDQLQNVRYRDGKIENYMDRLHYMTDWIYENGRKGIVKDMSREIGGSPLPLALSFISTHPESYKPLRSHPTFIREIAGKEKEINARPCYYLPKEEIVRKSREIKNGDILCFVTSIQGLDVTHVGIAYWQKGTLTFIHASSSAKKVIVQPTSLQAYTREIKSCKGLLVARPMPVH